MCKIIDKDEFIGNYLTKQNKKHNLPFGMRYYSWLATTEEKAEKLYKAYLKKQNKK